MGKVYVVGVGPGNPKYLTEKAKEAIGEAEAVVGWDLSLQITQELIKNKKVYPQTAENFVEVAKNVASEHRDTDNVIAYLTTGDPCVSSGIRKLEKIFDGFDMEVVSGVSSIQVASGIARVSLEESAVVSFHHLGDVEERKTAMLNALRQGRNVVMLAGEVTPDEAAEFLITSGIRGSTRTVVCENLTFYNEKITRGTLNDVRNMQFSPLSVIVVINPKTGR